MKKLILLLALFTSLGAAAADVDTLTIPSAAMHRSYKCVVIRPDSYKKSKEALPTLYLLHGLTGKFSDWVTKAADLKAYADRYNMLVVCPDGAFSSWYFDSPIDSSMRFETYVASEIPAFVESRYHVIKNRKGRAISGLSMGGHGGLYLGRRHSDFFGAIGSMSGALAIEMITSPMYGVEKRLGDTSNHTRYRQYSIFGELEKPVRDTQAIILDCGTEDFIVEMSRLAHKKMLDLKLAHDYTERPGKHDWAYWNNAVQYQMLFFRNYFDRARRTISTKP